MKLGRYALQKKIASGGMADVYHAKLYGVEGFEKDVAIKKILPHWSLNPDFVDMLVDEAKVLLHLTHSNIVQVYELNRDQTTYYLAMEYVDGVDLRAMLRRLEERLERLPLPLVIYISHQILNGLQFAHTRVDKNDQPLHIVHRDISPQNILLSFEGEVKVTDFGIAKAIGKTSETVTGTLKGKFSYMSPEQATGKNIDQRTDLFAMGILLYEMITGKRCFKGNNDLDTLEAVKKAEVTFPEDLKDHLPEALKAFVLKALKKEIDYRYQTASEMLADLKSLDDSVRSASSTDLKLFLASLFPERIQQKKTNKDLPQTEIHSLTEVVEQKTKVLGKPAKGKKIVNGTLFLIVLGILVAGAVILKTASQPEIIKPVMQKIPEPVTTTLPPPVISEPVHVETTQVIESPVVDVPKVEPVSEEPKSFGALVVRAKPWGKVFLSGIVFGVETPYSNQRLPTGDYSLKVFFPPQNKSLTESVRITKEHTLRCQANFDSTASIVCN